MMANRYAIAHEIQQLAPQGDAQRIMYLLSTYEHPWLMRKALEFALFRTYAAPRISRLLKATGQFQQHGQKRYDDTSLLLSTLIERGYDSPYGETAIARMNHWHGHYRILNEDFLYVLSVFIYEPVRWINRFGWRALTPHEGESIYHFWAEIGRRMGIQAIPASYADFETFNLAYERTHFVYAESNYVVGEATVQVFLQWYPSWLRPAHARASMPCSMSRCGRRSVFHGRQPGYASSCHRDSRARWPSNGCCRRAASPIILPKSPTAPIRMVIRWPP